MENLTQTDWQKLLLSIEVLNADIQSNNLAKRLTEAVNLLVSNEIVSFDIFGAGGDYQGYIVFEPFGAVAQDDLQVFGEFVHEHPLYEDLFVNRKQHTMTFSDYVSRRDFEQTALYNEFYRRVGVDHQISVALPVNPENFVTCALSRYHQTFGESERTMMNLFKPHLTAAIRNSWLFEQIRKSEETWKASLEHGEHGIIILNAENKPEFISSRAIRILEKHFTKDKLSANCLPLEFWNWVSAAIQKTANFGEYSAPPAPLIVENDGEELKIEICFDTELRSVTLLLKTKSLLSPAKLLELGITKAQATVLYRVALGKTNAEIARLGGISPRTVQKHLENICNKLGVENRTAAVMRVTEFFGMMYVFIGDIFRECFV